jgi:hypothetical protein
MSDVEEIKVLHAELVGEAETAIAKAIRIGELLSARQKGLAHGEWLPWVKANLPFTERTARRYLRLYANRAKLPTVGDLAIKEALEMSERILSVEAKSKRNRARLAYIAAKAAQPVIEALNEGKVSISVAEQVAHLAPESQAQALADMPKPRAKAPDTKTVSFPVDPETKERLWFNDFASDNAATTQLEIDGETDFTAFQRDFARAWRKLVKEYLAQGLSYSEMYEQGSDMMRRIFAEHPRVPRAKTDTVSDLANKKEAK